MDTKSNSILYIGIVALIAAGAYYFLETKIAHAETEIDQVIARIPIETRAASQKMKAEKQSAAILSPIIGSAISSPVKIIGSAPGTWYFEASLPVKITDHDGVVLGQGPAMAQGDWMTEKSVPFVITLPFDPSSTADGYIVVEADNPSGRPNPPSVRMPITFSKVEASSALCTSTIAGACAPAAIKQMGS